MHASCRVDETLGRSESKGCFMHLRGDPVRAQPRRFPSTSHRGEQQERVRENFCIHGGNILRFPFRIRLLIKRPSS